MNENLQDIFPSPSFYHSFNPIFPTRLFSRSSYPCVQTVSRNLSPRCELPFAANYRQVIFCITATAIQTVPSSRFALFSFLITLSWCVQFLCALFMMSANCSVVVNLSRFSRPCRIQCCSEKCLISTCFNRPGPRRVAMPMHADASSFRQAVMVYCSSLRNSQAHKSSQAQAVAE